MGGGKISSSSSNSPFEPTALPGIIPLVLDDTSDVILTLELLVGFEDPTEARIAEKGSSSSSSNKSRFLLLALLAWWPPKSTA